MKLISLELENFRQHKESRIEFSDGITIITGSNGAGKSTILEAISWAIYGTEAARGNKDTIKWNKAPARSKVRVELIFAIDNETFKVIRELNKAEIYINTNEAPLAISQDEVTKYLTEKLGMNRVEFFNTYFTGQKELNFLGNQKAADRRKFISKVLNYEKVREAQEKVRTDKNSLVNEISGIKQGLGNIEAIQEEKAQAQQKSAQLTRVLNEKQNELNKLTLEQGKLMPEWTEIKTIREDYNKYNTELKFTLEKIATLEKNILNLKDENSLLETKSRKLQELELYLDEYKKVEGKIIEQEKLQKYEIEKQKLTTSLENTDNELLKLSKRFEEIYKSAESKKEIPAFLINIKEEIDSLKAKLQEETKEWTSNKQEIKTLKKQKEIEFNKAASQYSIIEQKGENGTCPTCERPLKGEFEKVTSQFKENIEILSKEMQDLILKEEGLSTEPSFIKEKTSILLEKEKKYQEYNRLHGQLEEEVRLYEEIKEEISKKTELKDQLQKELLKVPQGFDKKLLEKLKEDFSSLKRIYDEIIGLKAQIVNRDKIQQSLNNLINEHKSLENIQKDLQSKLSGLNYSEQNYEKLQVLVDAIQEGAKNAQYAVIKAEGELKEINAVLSRILSSEGEYKEKQNLIKSKQNTLNHLLELDRFYGQFLEKLNNQARPELSEYASRFLNELTEGRYSTLELNDKYEVCLFDDGEVKPIISGGEEDIANLCLRLAISQMIAQRSGRTLSLLILDEVFGSLDENRRNNVISLLNSLTNSFEQVILITHIDDIKENIDNIVKVEYDEEQGCSIVSSYENLQNIKDLAPILTS